jgi:hypothetical protein
VSALSCSIPSDDKPVHDVWDSTGAREKLRATGTASVKFRATGTASVKLSPTGSAVVSLH